MKNTSTKTRLLLIYGGQSVEHDVSIMSAHNIYAAIDHKTYNVMCAYIDRSGEWWQTAKIDTAKCMGKLTPLIGTGSVAAFEGTIRIDVIFAVIHGQTGEDGVLQSFAQLLPAPIVGCNVESSVLCMNKVLSKILVERNGVPIVPYIHLQNSDEKLAYHEVSNQLGVPFFIKPVRLGSSVGVVKVHNKAEYHTALNQAFKLDSNVLIETAIDAREIEISVLGHGSAIRVSGVGEIIPDREFYDYTSKYDPNSKSIIQIPANIPDTARYEIQNYAQKVYETLGCAGLARVDFFLSSAGEIYFSEINSMPGFTNISMYPKLWEAEGISQKELTAALIAGAIKQSVTNDGNELE